MLKMPLNFLVSGKKEYSPYYYSHASFPYIYCINYNEKTFSPERPCLDTFLWVDITLSDQYFKNRNIIICNKIFPITVPSPLLELTAYNAARISKKKKFSPKQFKTNGIPITSRSVSSLTSP